MYIAERFALFLLLLALKSHGWVFSFGARRGSATTRNVSLKLSEKPWLSDRPLPKAIIFDLDGCLWRPEMYELLYFSAGAGAPFTPSDEDPNVLLTKRGEPVQLLGNVRDVMRELHTDPKWEDTLICISSRTDQPDWARELLTKFQVQDTGSDDGSSSFVLDDVFNGPRVLASDSKVQHFQRISKETGISLEDMLFFDNEYGNCERVSELGVTVGYCPNGVENEIWQAALDSFPSRPGAIVSLGY